MTRKASWARSRSLASRPLRVGASDFKRSGETELGCRPSQTRSYRNTRFRRCDLGIALPCLSLQGWGLQRHAACWSRSFCASPVVLKTEKLRAGFRQNGFFADFYFWAAGFFRGFCRRSFSPHFCAKKCPEKSSRKIPGKILQNLYNKNPPTHFCRLAGAKKIWAQLFRLAGSWLH